MTQETIPKVGENLTRVRWETLFGNGDGIVNDTSNTGSFALTLSVDSATVAAGQYRIDGFVYTLTGTEVRTLPSVGSTTVYTIGILRTPTDEATGQLALVSGVKGAITVPTGGTLRTLYEVTRTASTPMSVSTAVADYRSWSGEVVLTREAGRRPTTSPRGSILVEAVGANRAILVRDVVSGTLTWVDQAAYVPPTSITCAAASGWTVGSCTGVSDGNISQLIFSLNRTGPTIAATSTGNITNTTICTVPTQWRPLLTVSGGTGSAGPVASYTLGTDGLVQVTAYAPGVAITTGDVISATFTYIRAI